MELANAKLYGIFRNGNPNIYFGKEVFTTSGFILDLNYSFERNEFWYNSTNKMAYIRKLSPNGTKMTLITVLREYEAKVMQTIRKYLLLYYTY